MKIYIAAKYERRFELQAVDKSLTEAGHECTSQWIWGAEEGVTRTKEQNAVMDVEDVLRADCVLFFSQPLGSLNKGGGRYFELGLGYGAGKRCIVVGEREIVFHHLTDIEVHETLESALAAVQATAPFAPFDTEGRD